MKKFLLITALLILALGALTMPAAAQEIDLTTMAAYLPADAPVYVGFRTDEAFVGEVDAFLDRLGNVIPMSFSDALDGLASDITPGETFATVFRPWLGDQVGVGVYDLHGQTAEHPVPPVTIAFAITDADEANAFLEGLPNADRYTSESGDGYTLYTPTHDMMTSDPYYVVRDDVMILTGDEALAEAGGVLAGDSLSDNPALASSLDLLPAESYSAVVYVDTPSIYRMAMEDRSNNAYMSDSDEMAMGMMNSLFDVVQPQAFGLTMLDERTLAIDAASPMNTDAGGPFVMSTSTTPIDPTFAAHLPANAPFVVQGTDLYNNYQNAIANLHILAEMLPESERSDRQNFELAIWGIGFFVRGMTGMEVEDALGWMTSDYAITLGFSPAFTDSTGVFAAMSNNPIEFGVTIATSDDDKAQAFFDGLNRALSSLPAEELHITQDTLPGGTPVLTFTIASRDMPFPITLMAAYGDGVFSFGTPRTVTAAVEPDSGMGGLDSAPSYVEAAGYALENSSVMMFLSSSNLMPFANLMTSSDNPPSIREQGKQIRAFLDLFSSMSVTASALPDNSGSLTRFVWTLAE